MAEKTKMRWKSLGQTPSEKYPPIERNETKVGFDRMIEDEVEKIEEDEDAAFESAVSVIDVESLLKKYKNQYIQLRKSTPSEPIESSFDPEFGKWLPWLILLPIEIEILLLALHMLSWFAYLFTFTLWDPRDTTWGWVTGFFIWSLIVGGVLIGASLVIYLIVKIVKSVTYQLAYKAYLKEFNEVTAYNQNLHQRLTDEVNDILKKHKEQPIESLCNSL